MKKILIIALFIFPFSSYAAFTVDFVPNSITDRNESFSIHVTGVAGDVGELALFDSNGRVLTGSIVGDNAQNFDYYPLDNVLLGDLEFNWFDGEASIGNIQVYIYPNGTLSSCIVNWDNASFENELGASPSENLAIACSSFAYTSGTLLYGPQVEIQGAFITMVSEGDTVMTTVTGENMGAGVSWVGENFIKLFIGSGLALLSSMIGWIVALVIIGAIVYFAYRAFRFFRT